MKHHEIVIIGGGNAGISLAARLLRKGATDVAVVVGEEVHRYRPLLNYVGAGQATMKDLERPMADVVPHGCAWIKDEFVAVDAGKRRVTVRTPAGSRTIDDIEAAASGGELRRYDGYTVMPITVSRRSLMGWRSTARAAHALRALPRPDEASTVDVVVRPLRTACHVLPAHPAGQALSGTPRLGRPG